MSGDGDSDFPHRPTAHLGADMKTLIALALLVPSAALAKGPPVISISLDSDGDGIYDYKDLCDGEDDTVDLDSNSVPDCSETFADDFGFEQTAAGSFWTTGGSLAWYGWQSNDANGYSGSGSYQVYVPSMVHGGSVVSDCMSVTPSTPHVMLTQLRHQSFAASPRATLYVYSFDSMADCQGSGSTGRKDVDVEVNGAVNSWITWGDRFTTDSTAQAVKIYAFSSKIGSDNGSSRFDIDNILLHDTLGDSEEDEGDPGKD